jgi:serine/threonine-protein kinase HipA
VARNLDVYLHENLVGVLAQDPHGDMTFRYAEGWLTNPDVMALSQSVPLRAEPFSHRECKGFFGGILPEGNIREVIARNEGISAKNDVALLEAIGGDCAGAVTFVPSGAGLPIASLNESELLTDEKLAGILRSLPRRPLLAGDEEIRMSLAGAQSKLAVGVTDGRIYIPRGGTPSTHILKPEITGLSGIVANEFLCMSLAKAIGLPTPSVSMHQVDGIYYLLVERYDRTITNTNCLQRLHQEDFCQALGILSENKYEREGGPTTANSFQLIRDACSIPATDIGPLLDAIVFNYLIGNNDAHGKNFSLLYRRNSAQALVTSFAPLYDLICTVYYQDLSNKMAMKLGGEYESARVYPRHFERMALNSGLAWPGVKRRVQALAADILLKLPEITPDNPTGIGVAEIIRGRCNRAIEMFNKP